jgi:hypothetical protein
MPPNRIVLLALVAVTFVLAAWGWYDINRETMSPPVAFDRALFRAIRALTFDGVYANPAAWNWDWRIYLASWLGAFVTFWALLLAGRALFRTQLARLSAKRARNHLVIIGDHPLAHALRELSRQKTVHLTFKETASAAEGNRIVLPAAQAGTKNLDAAAAANAARIVVAMNDDSETAELAFGLARQYPAPMILAHMRDPWLAEHLHHAPDGARLCVFSEAQAAAREILTRHPPYLLAMHRGLPRIHAVILGCGSFGEALACELALSCRVRQLDRPKIALLDLDAGASEARFLARHPYAREAADIAFHEVRAESLVAELADIGDESVSAVFVTLKDGVQALSAAIALKERVGREGLWDAPIFVRTRSGGGLPRLPATGRLPDRSPLIPFGGIRDIAAATGILSGTPDAAARAWHGAYLTFQRKDEKSATAWEDLAEEYRVANRWAVAHIPAKLASAGFDLEPWLNTGDLHGALPALDPGQNIFRDEEELSSLASLEHDRWMADRHFNGWRYAHSRDNARKRHDNLVPFEQLSPEVQDYDRKLIVFLDQFLPRRAGGLVRATQVSSRGLRTASSPS